MPKANGVPVEVKWSDEEKRSCEGTVALKKVTVRFEGRTHGDTLYVKLWDEKTGDYLGWHEIEGVQLGKKLSFQADLPEKWSAEKGSSDAFEVHDYATLQAALFAVADYVWADFTFYGPLDKLSDVYEPPDNVWKVPKAAKPQPVKEPWQMTLVEFRKKNPKANVKDHKAAVEAAVKEGEPVSEAVLKDYPKLAKLFRERVVSGAQVRVRKGGKAAPAVVPEVPRKAGLRRAGVPTDSRDRKPVVRGTRGSAKVADPVRKQGRKAVAGAIYIRPKKSSQRRKA